MFAINEEKLKPVVTKIKTFTAQWDVVLAVLAQSLTIAIIPAGPLNAVPGRFPNDKAVAVVRGLGSIRERIPLTLALAMGFFCLMPPRAEFGAIDLKPASIEPGGACKRRGLVPLVEFFMATTFWSQ